MHTPGSKRPVQAIVVALVLAIAALTAVPSASAQPDGTMLVLSWDSQKLSTVDAADATTTEVGAGDVVGSTGIEWDSSTNTLFAMSYDLDPDLLYTVDPDTGASTEVGSLGIDDPTGLAIHPVTGVMYITYDGDESTLATVDKTTAAVTDIGPTEDRIGAMAFDPTGTTLYGLSYGSDLYEIDTTTGALTLLFSDLADVDGASGLAFDCEGTLYSAQYDLVIIDPTTGGTSVVGELGLVTSDEDFVEAITVICDQTPPTTTSTTSSTTSSTSSTTTSTTSTSVVTDAQPSTATPAAPTTASPQYTG